LLCCSTASANRPAPASLTLSGNNTSRVFDITSQNATVSVSGLTITGGNANPPNNGVAGNQGGDLFNSGKQLTLTSDLITGGTAAGGWGATTAAAASSTPPAPR
jgi:hypothetical protein